MATSPASGPGGGSLPQTWTVSGTSLFAGVNTGDFSTLVPGGVFLSGPDSFIQILDAPSGNNILLAQTISGVGELFVGEGAAQPGNDADIEHGACALWIDPTPGATALKLRAKDSGGTVRTATIPLS